MFVSGSSELVVFADVLHGCLFCSSVDVAVEGFLEDARGLFDGDDVVVGASNGGVGFVKHTLVVLLALDGFVVGSLLRGLLLRGGLLLGGNLGLLRFLGFFGSFEGTSGHSDEGALSNGRSETVSEVDRVNFDSLVFFDPFLDGNAASTLATLRNKKQSKRSQRDCIQGAYWVAVEKTKRFKNRGRGRSSELVRSREHLNTPHCLNGVGTYLERLAGLHDHLGIGLLGSRHGIQVGSSCEKCFC